MAERRETKLLFREAGLAEPVGMLVLGLRSVAGFPSQRSGEGYVDDVYWAVPGDDGGRQVLRYRRMENGRGEWQWKHLTTRKGNQIQYKTVRLNGFGPDTPPPFDRWEAVPQAALRVFTHRRTLEVSSPSGPVSVTLDRSTYWTPAGVRLGEGVEMECHAELSCRSFDVVVEWLRANFGLVPASRSKLSRGLAMLGGKLRPRKVVLDCDPGVDDAIALLFVMASSEIDLCAVTTVAGNAPLTETTLNALHTLRVGRKFFGRPLPPVGIGMTPPGPIPDARDVHGPDGLGGQRVAGPFGDGADKKRRIPRKNAADLTASVLDQNAPGTVTLVATGPLTNLAALAERHPASFARARAVVAMGGAFFSAGNRERAAEFNIFRDPESAARVVAFCRQGASDTSGPLVPLTFVGLDVTHQVRLFREDVAHFEKGPGAFIRGITGFYMDFYERNEGLPGCYLHDPLALALVADPSLCETEPFHVEIETKGGHTAGASIADSRPTRFFGKEALRVTNVCVAVNAERARRMILERVLIG